MQIGKIHYVIGTYVIGYGTLVLLTLVGVFPGPLSFRFTVGHFLWALGVALTPVGVYYVLTVKRGRGPQAAGDLGTTGIR